MSFWLRSTVPESSALGAVGDDVGPSPCGFGSDCLSQAEVARVTIRSVEISNRTSNSNSMWGGRFAEGPAAVMREINASIPFDKRLWAQDIRASKAHVAMLAAQAIVSPDDAKAISDGLDQIAEEYETNGVPVDLALEDIHMATEARLAELIGPVAGRLHTARSRNDQVATDFRIWVTN